MENKENDSSHSNQRSLTKGVVYDKTNKRWRLIINQKLKGVFKTKEAAEHAAEFFPVPERKVFDVKAYQKKFMQERRAAHKAAGFRNRTVVIHADDMVAFDAFVRGLKQP